MINQTPTRYDLTLKMARSPEFLWNNLQLSIIQPEIDYNIYLI